MDRIILHIDMNSYFASVEQQANPFLRGKPVGVCAYLSDNGCIIASSIEAKKIGIKVGLRVKDARAIDPKVVLIQNDPAKYRSTTEKIFSILNRYTDEIEPYSIDEAFLDLTGYVKNFEEAEQKAKEIQKSIKRKVGKWLRASIGISFTRFLAKLGSDMADKGNVLVLNRESLPELYERIQLTDIWGINTRLETRLNALGIFSPLQLKNCPVANLMQSFGKMGYYLWANLNGIELVGVQKPAIPKSIGHSYCVPRITNNADYHKKILMKLCEKTGRRLRQQGLFASGLGVYWRYKEAGGYAAHRKIKSIFNDTSRIYHETIKLYDRYYSRQPISLLAVSVFDLQPPSGQLSLFRAIRAKNPTLVKALDKINDIFGEYTVFWGSMWDTARNAPERIGFRKTVPVKFQNLEITRITYE